MTVKEQRAKRKTNIPLLAMVLREMLDSEAEKLYKH